jgi:uncharacterized Fe-S center protein
MKTLTNKEVKIRKPHKCWGCAKEFPIGTIMRFTTQVDSDNNIASSYWCEKCQEILRSMELEDEFEFGELAELIDNS